MKRSIFFIVMIALTICTLSSLAQKKQISGRVTNQAGEVLPAATVSVKERPAVGAITDGNGEFKLFVPEEGKILVISFIGFVSKEITIGANRTFSIVLQEDVHTIDDVTVVGIRSSFAKAEKAKRNADKVVDGISSEDIGKLPDPNIAEALQRVTGVQIQRENASGAYVSIRGLDPTFTKVTVNGQSQTAARSRSGETGFNLSVLGSSIASALEVVKSPTADMEEGGVGGTVNIKKLRPFDIGQNKGTIGIKPTYEVNAESVNPRVDMFYNRMINDKWGISASAYYYDRDFERTRVRGESSPEGLELNGQDVYIQDRLRPRLNRDNEKNLSISSTLQFKASERFNAYADVTYGVVDGYDTRFDADIRVRTSHVASSAVANETGFINDMPVTGFRSLGFGGFSNNTNDKVFSFATGFDYDLSENTNLKVEAARSFNKKINDDLPGVGGSILLGDGSFDPTPDDENDVIARIRFGQPEGTGILFEDIAGIPDFSNINNYTFGTTIGSNGTLEKTRAEEYSVRFDLETKLNGNFFSSLKYGAKYTVRTEEENNIRRAPNNREILPTNMQNYLVPVTEYQDILPGFMYYGINVRPIVKDVFSDPSKYTATTDGAGDDFYAQRKITAGYGMLSFKNNKWRGNVGVRVVNTNTETRGWAAFGGDRRLEFNPDGSVSGYEVQVAEKNYTDFLPSLNLVYNVSDDLIARFAAGRVMRRPEIREMTPFFEIGTDRDELSQDIIIDPENTDGEAGNPELDPFTANQFDLSLEYYIKGGGMITAGAFYKDVDNFITGDILPRAVSVIDPQTGQPLDLMANVATYINGGGAVVRGVELAYQQPFTFLPGVLSGLGTAVNYTLTDSETEETKQSLDGTSKHSLNATIYYERLNWGMRVAHNYRDRYRTGSGGGRQIRKAQGFWDASAYYALLKGKLKATVNFVNFVDRPFLEDTFTSTHEGEFNGDNFSDYELSGRQIIFGLTYTF